MAFQILLCHGRYPGRDPLGDYDFHRDPKTRKFMHGHFIMNDRK